MKFVVGANVEVVYSQKRWDRGRKGKVIAVMPDGSLRVWLTQRHEWAEFRPEQLCYASLIDRLGSLAHEE